MNKSINKYSIKLLFSCLVLLSISCVTPTKIPIIKDYILAKEKEKTERTEEAIKNSKVLQELDSVCNSIPLMKEFSLIYKDMNVNNRTSLSFAYYSEIKFADAEKFYTNHFLQNNWKLIEKGNLSSDYFVYEKDGFRIGIYYSDTGDGVTYLRECDKISTNKQ
jgi:hypothetical protein